MAENMSIDKVDSTKDESGDESMKSSPGDTASVLSTHPEKQQPKRRGGRKPIYATSEERKQRNRQAQAAFRERRTEYIKQLEEAIRTHEQNLANLQTAHRSAADECLMLRYKNSLLERILLEKGIDVKAELRAKTGSPTLGPAHLPQNMVPAPPLQRSLLNRDHARRRPSSIAPKLEPGGSAVPLPPPLQPHVSMASPTARPTPSHSAASPSATTAYSAQTQQHGASPTASDHVAAPARPSMAAPPPVTMKRLPHPPMNAMAGGLQLAGLPHTLEPARATDVVHPSPLYPPASFPPQFKQPDHEYETAELLDDQAEPPDTPSGSAMYLSPAYASASDPHSMSLSSPTTNGPPNTQHIPGQVAVDAGAQAQLHQVYTSMTQLLDPSFDLDPFGLNASMAFPSHFSFGTSNMR